MKFASWIFSLGLAPTLLAYPTSSYYTRYAGTKVVRIPTSSSTSALGLLEALITRFSLQSWTAVPIINSHVDVEVPASKFSQVTKEIARALDASGVTAMGYGMEIMHEDLGASIIEESSPSHVAKRSLFGGLFGFIFGSTSDPGLASWDWFNSYHPYSDHLQFLADLASQHPHHAEVINSGKSVEGRVIAGIHIYGASGPGSKPAVIWHGNVHAREWITSMVNEYMAYELLNNYSNSTEIKTFVDSYDFYIFPIVNPDGFVYTQTTERMWRKNRQEPANNGTCSGRDMNRNWDVAWDLPEGASVDPCSDSYKGERPSDTPEITALAEFLNERASSPAGAKMYIDWHSFSQMIFSPYGFDCERLPPDHDELVALEEGFANALQQLYGTEYTYGATCATIYQVSGASNDYSYVVSNIKYSFGAELRDKGQYGFILPPKLIRPTGEETWAGIRTMLSGMK